MKQTHFFLGANSGEGFYSLYDQMLNGQFDDLLILKGGPGCGKSTFMRRMGEAMERAGERVVYQLLGRPRIARRRDLFGPEHRRCRRHQPPCA